MLKTSPRALPLLGALLFALAQTTPAYGTQPDSQAPSTAPQGCRATTISFMKNRAELTGHHTTSAAKQQIDATLECIARSPKDQLIVLGFASREGEPPSNVTLAQQRADITAALIEHHFPRAQVTAMGLGTALPTALGLSEERLAENRRAVVIMDGAAVPCPPIRVFMDRDGNPTANSLAALRGTSQCYERSGVKQVLGVIPQIDQQAARARAAMVAAWRPFESEISLSLVHADSDIRQSFLSTVMGITEPKPLNGAQLGVDLYPLIWETPALPPAIDADANAFAPTPVQTRPAPTPVDSAQPAPPPTTALLPAPSQEPDALGPDSGQKPVAYLQLSGGIFRGLGHYHLGGTLRTGGRVATFGPELNLLLGIRLSAFAGPADYQLSDTMSSNVLISAYGAVALSRYFGPLRLTAELNPGLLLPTGAAILLDGEGSAAIRLHPNLEVIAGGGGGADFWGDGVSGHWHSTLGVGAWL